MPYFKNKNVNILFIHIPKTGGTSLENYFEKNFEIKLNKESLYTINPEDFFNGISYQHQVYKIIKTYPQTFIVDYEDITIISIVRNPYNRIVSDLFYSNLIQEYFTSSEVYSVMKKYLEEANDIKYDNHRIPQYLFLTDENDNILQNIKILKTETLNDDMKSLGYNNFTQHNQVSWVKNKNYYSYLNVESVKLINNFYDKDFDYFNYKKISTDNEIELNQIILNEEIIQSKKTIKKYLNNYFDSIHKYIDSNELTDKNDLGKLIFPKHRNITDNYTSCYKKVVEELSKNYKDIVENK
jgi:hypothetical protein